MKKIITLIVAALLCAPAIARDKERDKDYITQNGDGTYSCSGKSTACAQINQQRDMAFQQRDREHRRELQRQGEEQLRSIRALRDLK